MKRIHQLLSEHFDSQEIKTLCFRLGVDYDNLGGEGKESKARELVLYCKRHGLLAALTGELKALRPQISWPDQPEDTLPEDAGVDKAGTGAKFNVNVSGGTVGKIISIDKAEEITID